MFSNGYKVNMERWEGRGSRGGAVGAGSYSLATCCITGAGSAGITPTSTPSPRLQHIRDNHVTPPAAPTAHGARLAARPPSYTTHPTVRAPCSLPLPSTLHSAPAAVRSRKHKTHRTARDKDVTARCPLAVCRAQLVSCQLPAAFFPFPPPPVSRHLFYMPCLPAARPRAEEYPIPATHARARYPPAARACVEQCPPRVCIALHPAHVRHLPVPRGPLHTSPASVDAPRYSLSGARCLCLPPLAAACRNTYDSRPRPRRHVCARLIGRVCATRARHAAFVATRIAAQAAHACSVFTHTHQSGCAPTESSPTPRHSLTRRSPSSARRSLAMHAPFCRTRRADFAERDDLASAATC
ncbi:hypothetical protein GGX14DRAFT_662064 [Mycena pura]|uniref:Uncharacterized protein n=1 Tax=Mycena pura TaxID=153505 RepID=A0AAD6V0X5_9AGAR|nr:hypothetical protein GGX14DRAFT_662064 [Mycena pura]